MRSYLVVGNQTRDSPELAQAILERVRPRRRRRTGSRFRPVGSQFGESLMTAPRWQRLVAQEDLWQ
jgi:hypothetical protein